jgi:hypothetical protein
LARFVPFLLLPSIVTLSTVSFSAASAADPAEASAPQESRATVSAQQDDLDQGAIYRILCGGAVEADTGLAQHLWDLAGNLADRAWAPPKVTIRVVVSDPPRR